MDEPGEFAAQTRIYRIGVKPQPLVRRFSRHGLSRFDDPLELARFYILYLGERRACFLERLGSLVPVVTDLTQTSDQGVTQDWLGKVGIASVEESVVRSLGTELDLTSAQVLHTVNGAMSTQLQGHRAYPLTPESVKTRERKTTQLIGEWAFLQGYASIRYECRYQSGLLCWAIICPKGEIPQVLTLPATNEDIRADDPDLVAAAQVLRVPVLGRIP